MLPIHASLSTVDGTPPSAMPPDITFFVAGDIQFTAGSLRGSPRQWQTRDGILLAKSQFPGIQFGLTIGDYGESKVDDGPSDQYDEIRPYMQEISDWYSCIGNHDTAVPSNAEDIGLFYSRTDVFRDFDSLSNRGYGHERRHGLHVILLNSIETANQGAAGGLGASGAFQCSETQLSWLQSILDSITEANARVVVALHAPLKTNAFNSGAIAREFQHEQTQADSIINILLDWQSASDKGLVLGVFSGHTHIDGYYQTDQANGKLDHYTLDELDGTTGYTGDATTITTDDTKFACGVVEWQERTKTLRLTGYGQQDSYLVDLSGRTA